MKPSGHGVGCWVTLEAPHIDEGHRRVSLAALDSNRLQPYRCGRNEYRSRRTGHADGKLMASCNYQVYANDSASAPCTVFCVIGLSLALPSSWSTAVSILISQ